MNNFFSITEPVISASAPGRLDVMGGIADYSGSLLLQMPIKEITTVSIQERKDRLIKLKTQLTKNKSAEFEIDLLLLSGKSYGEAAKIIKQKPEGNWALYLLGCLLVLEKEKNLSLTGLNIFIESELSWGKGVSSSAALEVAMMNALDKLYDLKLENMELAVLAQKAENHVVGAPCGLMDQLTTHLGKKNKLLPLICQPHKVFEPISIPKGISFIGIDSGVRHAVSGASYSEVRAAAFMAYTIIALQNGATVEQLKMARQSSKWDEIPFGGFLANISVADFDKSYTDILPYSITGKEFIEKFGVSIDNVTSINPEKEYFLKVCAAHPICENFRVNKFRDLLQDFSKQKDKQDALKRMGELMLESHRSYSAVGLGNKFTDEIITNVMEAGPENGVYGARVTGGGSGGTVCVLSYGKEGKQTVKEIYQKYKAKVNKKIFLFSGSNNGAFYLNKVEI